MIRSHGISKAKIICLFTAFVMLDFYVFMMPGLSLDAITAMCKVDSLGWTFVFVIGIPFNLFKDVIVVFITIILYKNTHRLIDRLY